MPALLRHTLRLTVGWVALAGIAAGCSDDTGDTADETLAATAMAETSAGGAPSSATTPEASAASTTTTLAAATTTQAAAMTATTATTIPVATPTLSGPVEGGRGQANLSGLDLAAAGYRELSTSSRARRRPTPPQQSWARTATGRSHPPPRPRTGRGSSCASPPRRRSVEPSSSNG